MLDKLKKIFMRETHEIYVPNGGTNDYALGRISGVVNYIGGTFDRFAYPMSEGDKPDDRIIVVRCNSVKYNRMRRIIEKVYPGKCVWR